MEILPFTNAAENKPAEGKPDAMPDHVWQALQDAAEGAAERLRDLIAADSFKRLKATDQARLIELAFNRAYGPPIKREMSLTLSGNVGDAVAESLGRLAAQDIPEMRRASAKNAKSDG